LLSNSAPATDKPTTTKTTTNTPIVFLRIKPPRIGN
jgi:hypothetical protein